ncbi:response regulator transcription factor [Flavobacterium salilacus subsp. salilacus]|uniref:response regulator transcription factor n=1 Tax=Flavobacterium TaxID=237 RepID=UPI001074EB05|nr:MULTISPECIES: response regulator transcription factor [Flavobacterium]KAF2517463.1 response regulator transcription factor [Flavobacterium salilacus subsp. salilacus]MBE1615607.1 response regulator transcription factor [Flavobacterium sp. SaA2.13]
MNNVVKIALADDEVLFRKGISFMLQREKNIEIIFEASDGQDLIDKLKEYPAPDIIVMDLKMPNINGVEATKIIRNTHPDIKIVALTSYNTKSFIANMIDVGAVSYVMKNTTPKELLTTINEVQNIGYYYNDYVMKVIQEYLISPRKKTVKSRFDDEQLTKREIQVLKLICKQYSGQEIANELCLSARTVEGHRNNLLRKTECKNMVGLIIYAIQNDFVNLENLVD